MRLRSDQRRQFQLGRGEEEGVGDVSLAAVT
jgi:hypothetical protein